MTRVDYTKLAASNELEGKVLDENLIKKIKEIGSKIKTTFNKGMENRKKQINKSGEDGGTSSYSQTLQKNGQKNEPKMKEYINPRKLPVANASYEPEGEIMNEQMNDKPNVPGSGTKKNVATDIKTKIKSALTNVKKQVEKNPAGFTLQNMSHEPEGEVIKEEE